jgi:type IV secretory pathway TrbD component
MADHPIRGGNGHAPDEEVVPAATEQLHLPGPSYIPVVVAAGVTLALVGVVISWFVFAFGMLLTVVAVVRWVRDTREDIADLPLEH